MIAADILKKLRLSRTQKILIVNAPQEYLDFLGDLSYEMFFENQKSGIYDFVQVFAVNQAELERLIVANAKAGKYDCLFWGCYPKGTGKIKSDIKRETVWAAFQLVNLNCVTQVSIDETWSALRARPIDTYKK